MRCYVVLLLLVIYLVAIFLADEKVSPYGPENGFKPFIATDINDRLVVRYQTPTSARIGTYDELSLLWTDLQECVRISMPNTIITVIVGAKNWHQQSYFDWQLKTAFLMDDAEQWQLQNLLHQYLYYSTDNRVAIELRSSIIFVLDDLEHKCLELIDES